ncbi:MAG TPA: NAD(P)-dependent alcohol dehydrogenase [Phycisphaerales bacterium]|nr:NAD(P)-dependent alcohol dehydrogenase [Phycisphaerales bacterium]HMP36127.1 NAD(P)-dependent alcohol dehydrogenase [Phycisphaerales bacterium]
MPTVRAYVAHGPDRPLERDMIDRRPPDGTDVHLEIHYCGVCHSDLHTARGEWPGVVFPVVPGHEIVGRVMALGRKATKFKVGDYAAIGCMVDSCRRCASCQEGLEQYCEKGPIFTYNSPNPQYPGGMTLGGYSTHIIIDEAFMLRLGSGENLAAKAPLLCAGITTWSPLRHWDAGPGKKVGVVGLGGLGHMAVRLSKALGAETVLLTGSPSKVEDGLRLGADHVVVTKDSAALEKHVRSMDLIVDTVSAPHDLDALTNLLRRDGTLCLLGAPASPHPSPSIWPLVMKRTAIAGSIIGGIAETQEMLDFCEERGIVADIELIPIQSINDAFERMLRGDVRYRFVIDLASLKD